ncbi:hypothetical protein PINS_up006883 [Pythium insidiosum]|nr:hypothetical protein PINS_up006883 [Pythium insidiosum]
MCGKAISGEISCLVERTGTWQPKADRVKSISVDGSLVYAIDTSNQLVWRDAYQKDAPYTAIKLPGDIVGRAVRVQADGRLLCIQDDNQYLYCANLDNATHQASWFQVGNSTHTMVNDFGVANGSVVWVVQDQPGVSFYGLPIVPPTDKTFRAVATDGNIVCASTSGVFEVFCASRETKNWQSIKEFLAQMSIHNGTMYALTREGNLRSFKLAIKTQQDASRRPAQQSTNNGYSKTLDAGAVIAIVLSAIVVIVIFVVVWRRRSQRAKRNATDGTDQFRRFHVPTASSQAATEASTVSEDQSLTMWTKDEALLAKRIPINDLELGSKVSRGAFGDVYRGRFDGQIVAIKVLAETKRCNLSEVSKFAQEARFMARLQHDHIACLVGVAWSTPSNLCIVSEFLAGGDVRALLQRYLNEGRPEGFSPDKIKIALHVAHALTYLHSLQPIVLHRDLKSKNILLTENGDAKLTDFGVSRELENATMTAGVGSSLWMAPEVIQGERYDEKADVYSFGVVLSELDTNELPFARVRANNEASSGKVAGENLPEVAILQLVAQGRLSVRFSDNTDPTLKEIGLACVNVDPSARPTSARLSYQIHKLWREMTE